MLTLTVDTLVDITGGTLLRGLGHTMVTDIVTDSREVNPGCAFVAFVGDRADGHAYIGDAVRAGSRAVIITRDEDDVASQFAAAARSDTALVLVSDALAAVQALATHHRRRLDCPVIAITGSTGKTTTKDMLTSVLSTKLEVAATVENRNNELGVPLTLLAAPVTADVVVIEMAMRGRGQLAELCRIVAPDLGLVTNVGEAHIEILGSQEAVADSKAELLASLPADGRAFLNGDDAWSEHLTESATAPVTLYGLGEGNDVRAVDVTTDAAGFASFALETARGSMPVHLSVPGRHNAYNAAAAAAVALHLGIDLTDIAVGLGNASGSPMRMETFVTARGVTVVNDAYNANPTSMRAALATLADMTLGRNRVAILGDMAELGSLTELAHFRLGERVAELGIDALIAVGPRAQRIADGALAAGMPREAVIAADDVTSGLAAATGLVETGDVVLVKASRVMGLEAIVEGIS